MTMCAGWRRGPSRGLSPSCIARTYTVSPTAGSADASSRARSGLKSITAKAATSCCESVLLAVLGSSDRKSLAKANDERGAVDDGSQPCLARPADRRDLREERIGDAKRRDAEWLVAVSLQQKSAADQVATAMVQIRESADQLATEQEQRVSTAERVDELVGSLEQALTGDTATNGDGHRST